MDPEDRFTFAYAELQRLLDNQIRAIDSLDDRANALARFNALIIGVVVTGVSALGPRVELPGAIGPSFQALTAAGLIALAFSMVQLVRTLLNREVPIGLDADRLVASVTSAVEGDEITSGVLIGYRDCVESNFVVIEGSVRRLTAALRSLGLGIVSLAAAAMLLSLGVALS